MAFSFSGLFDSLFGSNKTQHDKEVNSLMRNYFTTLNGYDPTYTSYDGAVYEIGLCRAIIHRLASECAKATPNIVDKNRFESKLTRRDKSNLYMVSVKPNPFMTAYQFYYRLATIFEAENNAFIVPIVDRYDTDRIIGLYPVAPSSATIRKDEDTGKLYIIYTFVGDNKIAIEYEKCGFMKRMQYKDDFYGESHRQAFKSTAELLLAQEEGSTNAIKASSVLRFMAKMDTPLQDEEDLKEQQELLRSINLEGNESGIFLYDSRFEDMKQIEGKPLLLDAEQKKAIENSAFTYWGVNEHFLQCNYTEEEWNAIYESRIEPFFIQAGEVITLMLYKEDEIKGEGKRVMLASDRLAYASNSTKLSLTKDYVDRGILSRNEARNIMNLPPIPGGDTYVIRSEYIEVDDMQNVSQYKQTTSAEKESGGKEDDGDARKNENIPNDSTNGKQEN